MTPPRNGNHDPTAGGGGDIDDDRLYESLLVLRCQTGDEAAFAELIERYQPRLRIFLTQMLRDAHAAEDVLQDVWLAVFRSVGKLRDVNAFAAWLYRVTRDRAYRLLRRSRAVVAAAAVNVPDEASTPAPNDAEDLEEATLLHASLDQLPHEQREVVLLRFVEGMSYEDIAAAVGCEIGTVRSRLHYAKRALRRDLEQKGLSCE